ncbi:putative choline dehydrogenase [Aspergillus taichungensis]|uniref:Putative choline dehydrogenase n=1 Tax=Aspergillus taichungensis TaxID=482145 RepID=A0A2J5I562_9EURO|nr:putative choline dehydrogenase [Aspergillus taichungensis]
MTRAHFFSQSSFDYLIVGGGTAGLALAARLSEQSQWHIGVIEAGPAALDDPVINVPGRYGEALGGPYDWQFETIAQPGLNGRALAWPRGKVLGGTSALNLMAWNRGHREDYDAWEELGNEGWGWDGLQQFFLRSETFHPPDEAHQKLHQSCYQAVHHGIDGPVQTIHPREYGPSHRFWHATLNAMGVESSPDSLGGCNSGAWNMVCTVDPHRQERSYAASAYYRPIQDRENLTVLCEATVLEILLEDHYGWTARGVKLRCNGEEFTVSATKEVILSAGSVQSPQLLELSGIGDRGVLEAAGIPVKIHNPNVGENLQEHMMTATVFELSADLTTRDDLLYTPAQRTAADDEYAASRTGPWTILPCSIAYCALSTLAPPDQVQTLNQHAETLAEETQDPHDALLARQFHPNSHRGQVEYLFDLGNWSPFFTPEPGNNKKYGTMLQMLQYPFSRGSIHIRPRRGSNEPATTVDESPIIDPRYYHGRGGHLDTEVMKLGLRFGDRICQKPPLASIIARRAFPAPNDDDTDRFVHDCTVTDWHREFSFIPDFYLSSCIH